MIFAKIGIDERWCYHVCFSRQLMSVWREVLEVLDAIVTTDGRILKTSEQRMARRELISNSAN